MSEVNDTVRGLSNCGAIVNIMTSFICKKWLITMWSIANIRLLSICVMTVGITFIIYGSLKQNKGTNIEVNI